MFVPTGISVEWGLNVNGDASTRSICRDRLKYTKPLTFSRNLFESFESESCLWNVKSNEYRNRNRRDVAYKKLIKIYQELEPATDRERVKNKVCVQISEKKRRKLRHVFHQKQKKYANLTFLLSFV